MHREILTVLLAGSIGLATACGPEDVPPEPVRTQSVESEPDSDALVEAQRVVGENDHSHEAQRLITVPDIQHAGDPTVWANPEHGLAAACSPVTIGVRVCLGIVDDPRAVLLESSLPSPAGDLFTVRVGDREFSGPVSDNGYNVVWTGSDANYAIFDLTAGITVDGADQAIVTDADGMEFRISLGGASAAINQAIQ